MPYLFEPGDIVRLNADGSEAISRNWRNNPRRMAFYHGYHKVISNQKGNIVLPYPSDSQKIKNLKMKMETLSRDFVVHTSLLDLVREG